MRVRALGAVFLLWLATPAAALHPRLPDAAARAMDEVSLGAIRGYVQTLASDAFAGRGVGHQGNRAAETFVADVLRDEHVPPAGDSYFQPVALVASSLGSGAHLTVTDDHGVRLADLATGRDFYPVPETGPAQVTAPLVFAGHGVTIGGADDYAGVAARGAIVLALDGPPDTQAWRDLSEADRVEVGTTERKVKDAAAHAALGVIIVRDYMADPASIWPRQTSVRSASYRLASALQTYPQPVAALSARAASPLRRALDQGKMLSATLTPDLVTRTVEVHNVLGFVEGRDPSLADEMVVLGGHLDHDGIDAQRRIYNGADDNASGTAAVLAAAGAFAKAAAAGERPARGVLFALWNAEEKGELGAAAFVAAPQPNRRMIADLNLDMVGRHEEVKDPDDWRFRGFPRVTAAQSANTLHLLGYSYSADLARDVTEANEASRLTLLEDYDRGAQGLLERSDHWPFLEHGIPAVFLTTGLHPDYHTPADDADKIDYAKLTRIAQLAARAAWIVADGPAPHYTRPD